MALKSTHLNSEYIIDTHDDILDEYDGGLPDTSKSIPFRFLVFGPFNIRKQPQQNHYKTFIGEQAT